MIYAFVRIVEDGIVWKKFALKILLVVSTFIFSNSTCDKSTEPKDENQELQQGEIYVDIYDADQACDGTTLFADLHDMQNPRIIEVDMEGNIIWEYVIPDNIKQHHSPGMDVEYLANTDHLLFVLPGYGVQEIDRDGNVVWSHLDEKISHDADRLPNGNTLYVYGDFDTKNDPCVKEVNAAGQVIWSWYARDDYNIAPYDTISFQGWIHTNAVTRMPNGNTLLSFRNFNLTVEINTLDEVVWSADWGNSYPGYSGVFYPHEPEFHPADNHLLICLQNDAPNQIVELDRTSVLPVWEYQRDGLRTSRDADRLPNGNTLILGVLTPAQESVIFEVTPAGEIVWQLKVYDTPVGNQPGWFYKAERICEQ